jgi:hypothetical protein
MKNRVSCGRSVIKSLVAAILVAATQQVVEAQTTHSVCPPGNPSAPCDYDSPGAALSDTAVVVTGDTLDIANDAYTLTGPLLVDRGLTLNFNDSTIDANGGRGIEVDGSSIIDINVGNIADNGVANFAPLEDLAYGQTFVSSATEMLTAFQFRIRTGIISDTLTIPGTVRSGGPTGPVIATATARLGPVGFGSYTVTFQLDRPVPVVQGDVYAVEYTPTSNTSILQALNPFADGTGYNDQILGIDYAFNAIGGAPVEFNDVTIRNGQAPAGPGGAVLVSNGAVVMLSGSTVQNNTAPDGGGGLANVNSYLTVSNSDISGNATVDAGGAVLTEGNAAATFLSQTTIDGNIAEAVGGGTAALGGGRVEIVDSTVSNNAALAAALDLDFLATNLTSVSCSPVQSFTANDIALSGFNFAIRLNGGNPVPNDLSVQGVIREGGEFGPVIATASALLPGGLAGIQTLSFTVEAAPVPLVSNATYTVEFILNGGYSVLQSATDYPAGDSFCSGGAAAPDWAFQTVGGPPGDGGGIYSGGEVNMANVTVSGNVGDGGFASAGNHRISAVLSTISNNSGNGLIAQAGGAGQGGVIAFGGSILARNGGNDCNLEDAAAFAISEDYNLIGDLAGCEGGLLVLQSNDQAGSAGAGVIDPLLGPLQDNGGPTFTQALDPASPALDAGANDPTCGFGSTPFLDQRGVSRPQGAACDIGAFELQPAVGPLQGLIDAAAPGATIVVPAGTYTEGITIGDGKILQGAGPGSTIIDVTGLGVQGVVATGDFTMTGIRVTGADIAGQGGGIDIELPGVVVLDDVRVDNNSASGAGGGIFVASGSDVTITNSSAELNNAGTDGGGIYVSASADIRINNIIFANNTAGSNGGGIYTDDAASVLIGAPTCTPTPPPGQGTNFISNNTAFSGNGGGLWTAGNVIITYSNFSDNTAISGGGIHQESTSASIDLGCSFMNLNNADNNSGFGGAGNFVDGTLTVSDTTFEANSAGSGGGALNLAIAATIGNSGFLTNSAPFGGGGAIRSTLGTLNSSSNTYLNNQSNANGGAVFIADTLVSSLDVFEDNSARQGGGAITLDAPGTGQMQLLNGLLQNNSVGEGSLSVSGRGGALEFIGAIGLIEDTQFLNNNAPESGDGNGQGGAIYTAASLELIIADSTISGSSAGDGGGIYNDGILSVARSTLTSNSVTDFNVEPNGGAIASTGTLNVSNSTISGNVVNPGPGNTGDGGAIASFAGGTAKLNNVTLAVNTAPDGGALYAEPSLGPLTVSNSLLFGNSTTTADCDRIQALGFNLYDVNPCPTQAATDIVGNPLIGLLTDNGGPTETQALLPGSPAQDAGAPVPLLFTQFDDLSAFTTRGSAAIDGNTLLLAGSETATTTGSAYVSSPVDVTTDFTVQFDFQITPGSAGNASDGLTFTIGDDPGFLGDFGGNLGIGSRDDDGLPPYVPSGPTVSGVSVEFDTWDNGAAEGANDPGQEHIGIDLDGSASSAALTVVGPAGTLSDGSVWTAWIDYEVATNTLEVRASNTGSRPVSPTVSLVVDILAETDANADGQVFVGFTGAASAGSFIGGFQRILNFQFANEVSCELVDQRGVIRPEGLRCDIGAFEGSAIPGTIDNAILGVTTNVSQPGVVDVPLIDIPIEKLTGVVGDGTNPPESAPLSSFPLSSFPLSSLDLQASPLSSFPLSSFPLSSFDIVGAPLSSFPLSSFPLLSVPGGWTAVIEEIPSLAGAPLQNVSLEQVLTAADRPAALLDNITLGSLAIQGSPLSSLSLAGLALGDNITVETLDQWLANAGTSSTVCGELAGDGFSGCETSDTVVSLQVKSAPLSSLPLSSLPLSSFPLSSFPLSSFPLSSLPLSSFPLSSFPLSSFPLSSLPLSSFPLSSLPLSSFPLSSLDLLFAPLSSLPLSSFPLSSLPLSSFDVGGQPFCQYYDTLALADGQPTCSLLGIDPSSAGLLDLLAALQGSGAATLASTPLSSFPLSSFDISSVPLSSFQLDFADVAGLPLSSFPLSSLPLSSLDVGGQNFCDFYDATAGAEGQSTCADLGISNTADFGELITALQGVGQSTFASTPLSSFPLSSLPLSSLPLSSFPLSSLEVNGAPLSSFPLSSFDILGSPLSSLPLSSLPLSSLLVGGTACDGCTTLGDAFAEGQVITDAPLSSLTGSSDFGDIPLGDLLNAFTLEYLFGVGEVDPQAQTAETLGEIADPGNLTLGQLLVSLILRSDFPWENISLSDLDPQAFAADNVVGYRLDFELNGTLVAPVTVNFTLSDEFYLVPGSARFMTQSQSGGTILMSPVPDPVMTPNPDGTVTMSFGPVSPGAFSDNTLQFVMVPPLSIGDFPAAASLNLGALPAATADVTAAAVEVVPSANNDSANIEFPASTTLNTLILGHISSPGENDYFRIASPPKGSRVAVFMTNPQGDNDLLLYQPLSTVEAKGQTAEAASLDSVPFEDDGVDFGDNQTVEPDALDDINIGVLPLSSLSTNRDDADEVVSAISDGEEFTLQVSGYNGSVSDQPYTLRVKVTPEVPVTQCSTRTWTTGVTAPQTWMPAGSWQPDTNAVFLVNWQRLADIEQALTSDGAAAADAALNAVNALVNAPGVVNGVVVDVATIDGVNYAPWDLDPCDVGAANSVVNAITAYLEQQRAGSPNLAYVTIVGSDEVIPFKRKGDETAIANQSTFASSFADNALYGAMVSRNFLSDDTYGDIDPVKWSAGRFLNIPELAVGRLVESAADIQTAAENYVAAGGLLTPATALSAGYDFVADASTDIQQTFSTYGLDSTPLVDQPDAADPWDRSRFLAEAGVTTNNAKDLVSFNMHFDYDEALPSSGDATGNYSDNLINVADLLGDPTIPDSAVDLTGRIWFTVGCHSGVNAADIAMLNGEPTQDWAQTLNGLGAVYVGQAAYGYGDTVALALTERLLANFARNLNGSVSTGQAHTFAKQDYFKDLGVYGEYDYKALQASVYFGLPMYRIQNPLLVEDPLPPLRPVITDPISNLSSLSLTIEPNVARVDDTEKGTVFSADDDTQFVHYRPLQPIIGVDVTSENPDEVARSAFITGLVTRDELVTDMAFARPVIDEGALEPEIETDSVVFPTRFANVASYRVPADPGPFADRQQLNIIAGQYTSNAGEDFGTQRIFESVDVQVFYQPAPDTAPDTVLSQGTAVNKTTGVDDTRPELDNIKASVEQAGTSFQAAFSVDATDTVGVVARVAVLYRQSFDGVNSTWVLVDLVKGSGNTWTGGGIVDGSGLINGEVDYLAQALDGSGNVANSSFKGTFYVAAASPLPPPSTGGDNGTFGIDLQDGNGNSVTPGQWSTTDPVLITVTNQQPGVSYEYALDSPSFVTLTGGILVTGDGVHFVTVREVGGSNSATFTVLIDTTPPAVLLSSPFNGQFVVSSDDAPIAAYDCLDSGSGPATCSGTVAVGQPVSMTPGTQTFSVQSTDFAGNPQSSASSTYYVIEPLALGASTVVLSVNEPVTVTGRVTNLDAFTEYATIDWGDGTTDALQLVEENGGWTFAATHEYAVAQAYTAVVVTVDFGGAYQQTDKLEFAVSGPTGLWAQGNGSSGIDWTGGANTVDGLVHSNSDIDIKGAKKTVNGQTRYVGSFSVRGRGHTFSSPPVQVAPAVWPFAFDAASYAPGGNLATALGSQYFDMSAACNADGEWELDKNTAPGLYWVPCEVQLEGSKVVANVTVISTDTIKVAGSRHEIVPFVDGLAFMTQSSDSNAIKISSSNSDFDGFLVARHGRIVVSASNQNFGCGLAANELKLGGSNRIVGQNCIASAD